MSRGNFRTNWRLKIFSVSESRNDRITLDSKQIAYYASSVPPGGLTLRMSRAAFRHDHTGQRPRRLHSFVRPTCRASALQGVRPRTLTNPQVHFFPLGTSSVELGQVDSAFGVPWPVS